MSQGLSRMDALPHDGGERSRPVQSMAPENDPLKDTSLVVPSATTFSTSGRRHIEKRMTPAPTPAYESECRTPCPARGRRRERR